MFRNSIDGTPPSSPSGQGPHGPSASSARDLPSLSHALDQYEEALPDHDNLVEPLEIAGIEVALGLAAIGVGTILALATFAMVAMVLAIM